MDKVVEHSPVPWVIDEDNPTLIATIDDQKAYDYVCEVDPLELQCDSLNTANAAFIVKAVNHFELMLEVLKDVNLWMASNRLDIEGANVYFQVKDTIDKLEGR